MGCSQVMGLIGGGTAGRTERDSLKGKQHILRLPWEQHPLVGNTSL